MARASTLAGVIESPRLALQLPPCPLLPPAPEAMDWRALHAFREGERGAPFIQRSLEYAQYLWMRGSAARAILCLDRALFAHEDGGRENIATASLPYRSLAWILTRVPAGVFIGNPRVHFQHLADRVRGPGREQRRARAWACWHVVRAARPEFSGDPSHRVREPAINETCAELGRHGIAGETTAWHAALSDARGSDARSKSDAHCCCGAAAG